MIAMKKILAVTVALVMAFAQLGWAEGAAAGSGGRQGTGAQIEEYLRSLNLSAEQKERLRENQSQHRQKVQGLRSSLRTKWQALQELLDKPGTSLEAVAGLVNEVKAAQGAILDARVESIFAVKSILTPEQYAQFQELMKNRQKKHKNGRDGNRKFRHQDI